MKGFIVYPTYRTEEGKAYIHLYGRLENGESFLVKKSFKPYFFIKEEDAEKAKKVVPNVEFSEEKLKDFDANKVIRITIDNPKHIKELRELLLNENIFCYEADIRFVHRFLIDQNIRGSCDIDGEFEKGEYVDRIYLEPKLKPAEFFPKLITLSFDIETSIDGKKLYCISYCTDKIKESLAVADKPIKDTEIFADEKSLLEHFRKRILEIDPDIITGWNVIDFDFAKIRDWFKEYKIPFDLGRSSEEGHLRIETSFFRDSKADFPGRMALDGIHLLKNSFISLENYKLNTAAKEFLNEKKLLDVTLKEFDKIWENDKPRMIKYNLKDAELVLGILDKSGALDLTIQRSRLSGMQLDRVSGSIASLDFVYLVETRSRGLVAPSGSFSEREERIKGGYVMESKPGIYDYVIVLDFKSLYPSIILTLNIDPYSYLGNKEKVKPGSNDVVAPNGAIFRNENGILPDLIQSLWKQRDKAKKEKNDLASYAIKILMNSFFGVLAYNQVFFLVLCNFFKFFFYFITIFYHLYFFSEIYDACFFCCRCILF